MSSSSSWRRGQALPSRPQSQSQSQPRHSQPRNTCTTNPNNGNGSALPAARAGIPLAPAPAVNPWGVASASASAGLAPKTQQQQQQQTQQQQQQQQQNTGIPNPKTAPSAAAAKAKTKAAIPSHSAWGKAATRSSTSASTGSRTGAGRVGGVGGNTCSGDDANNAVRIILQRKTATAGGSGGGGGGGGGGKLSKGGGGGKKGKHNNKQHQQGHRDELVPPSLQLQSGDFPSLTGTSASASASASANSGTGTTSAASTRATDQKSIARGWETAKVGQPKAKQHQKQQAAIDNDTAAKAVGGGMGARGKASSLDDAKPKTDAKKKVKKNDDSGAPENNNRKNKQKKDKKKKKDKMIPADPRLAAAFQPLPAARTDDAHAAHMINFPLAASASASGIGGGAGGALPKNKRGAAGFAHVDPTAVVIAKGRQRLGPRKKRLSTLKKKVLQERLRVWKERNGIPGTVVEEEEEEKEEEEALSGGSGGDGTAGVPKAGAEAPRIYHTVCLRNFVTDEEELVDDDEYDEIVSDLRNLAGKIGPVAEVYIPRHNNADDANGSGGERKQDEMSVVGLAFVRYQKEYDARAAIASFDALTIGGGKIEPSAVIADGTATGAEGEGDGDDWRSLMHRYSPLGAISRSEAIAPGPGEGTGNDIVIVVLENILSEDDFEDEDCLAESTDDIRALAEQFGTVVDLMPHIEGEIKGQVHVTFKGDATSGQNAAAKLNGMVVGGSSISARVQNDGAASGNSDKTRLVLILENVLTEDDFDDEDCLQESVEDILTMCKEIGEVASIKAHTEGDQKGQVHVVYASSDHGKSAVSAFDGKVVGGETISARLDMPSSSVEALPVLILRNLLTEDDYEDDEVLEETKADAMGMLQEYGDVKGMKVHVDGDRKGEIHVTYAGGADITSKAQAGIHGIVRGGQTIEAEIFAPDNSGSNVSETIDEDAEKPKPMFSGDKVIPERYAECKRIPKVPNKGIPRAYATKVDDDNIVPLINEMLGELMRLQLRSKDDKNARARRRLVMGLREVARGIKSHKVKMVIMADNLDEYGAIDEKLQEILDLAEREDVPVFFELTKRRLGKALGKTIKVAVVGIYSADGAYQQFKQLQKIYLRAPRKAPPASKD